MNNNELIAAILHSKKYHVFWKLLFLLLRHFLTKSSDFFFLNFQRYADIHWKQLKTQLTEIISSKFDHRALPLHYIIFSESIPSMDF